jgi:hypothetical protein
MGIVLTRWRRKLRCPFREEKGTPSLAAMKSVSNPLEATQTPLP